MLIFGLMISRVAIARAVAVAADVLQMGLFPAFLEGLASPFEAALDMVVCAVLTWLVGWHIAFLPSFLVEGLPFVDLAPTWTIAILIATRKKNPPIPASLKSNPCEADLRSAGSKSPWLRGGQPTLEQPCEPSKAVIKSVSLHEEPNMHTMDNPIPPGRRSGSSSDWPRAIMWISIVAIMAGSGMYAFHSCVEAPSRFAGDLTERVSNAAREFAAAFVKGTVTTQFQEYCTEIHPNLSLQVATLKEVEQFTRSDEAVIGNIPLPEVIVRVTAPVEYIYHLDLNDKWEFNLRGDVLTVWAPELRANKPSFDVSNMNWEVQKDSLIRNTSRVREELRQSLMPLAMGRGRAHVKLVRETARVQVTIFVEKWLRDRFKDGKKYRVKVYFNTEKIEPNTINSIENSIPTTP